jgi:hypothetical protein
MGGTSLILRRAQDDRFFGGVKYREGQSRD